MIPSSDFDIVGSFNKQRVSEIDAERSVNCFEYIDPLAKKPKSLVGTSGILDTQIEFPGASGAFRAEFVFNDIHYAVIGDRIYSVDSSDVVALLGTIGTSSGYVGVDANTYQMIFVDGTNGYIFDTDTSVFVQITDPAFPIKPIDVCYLDGFFLVANGNTNTFQLSEFNQGLIWGPDNNGTPSTFTMAAASANIVITFSPGSSINNYQIGTSLVFSGGGLPAELVADQTYYVVAIIGPTTINVSATNGGTPIISVAGGNGSITNNGQLQLGAITSHPGTIVACRTLHRRLFLFSQFFTEVWENAGAGTNLPFRRNNSLLIELGTPAIGSISVGFDKMFFLSQDRDGLGSVIEVIGSQPIPVSNKSLDFQLAQYAELGQVSDCRSFLIKENGLIFYRMNFTAANHTYCYNVSQSIPNQDPTKFWHEEELLNGDRHPSQTHAYFNGRNYVGDYRSPTLYTIDNSLYSNNGEAIKRMRITRSFAAPGYQRIMIHRLQIDLLQGNPSEDVSNPYKQQYIYLSISKDGGQTYGSTIKTPLGHIGQRNARSLWRKLGTIPRGQGFVAKFEYYEPTPFAILGASWVMEILPE